MQITSASSPWLHNCSSVPQPLLRSDLDYHVDLAWLSLTGKEQPHCLPSFPDAAPTPELATSQELKAPMSPLEVCCHQWDGGI